MVTVKHFYSYDALEAEIIVATYFSVVGGKVRRWRWRLWWWCIASQTEGSGVVNIPNLECLSS